MNLAVWRDGSMVKRTCCSQRGLTQVWLPSLYMVAHNSNFQIFIWYACKYINLEQGHLHLYEYKTSQVYIASSCATWGYIVKPCLKKGKKKKEKKKKKLCPKVHEGFPGSVNLDSTPMLVLQACTTMLGLYNDFGCVCIYTLFIHIQIVSFLIF